MPIYEYVCEECGHMFDVMQKMSDEPLKKCPKCKKEELRKKVSTGGFILKGSGWFKRGHSAS